MPEEMYEEFELAVPGDVRDKCRTYVTQGMVSLWDVSASVCEGYRKEFPDFNIGYDGWSTQSWVFRKDGEATMCCHLFYDRRPESYGVVMRVFPDTKPVPPRTAWERLMSEDAYG